MEKIIIQKIINNKKYKLSKLWKIVLARIFDIIISSILPILIGTIFNIITFKYGVNIFILPIILLFFGFGWLFIYFVVIPYFCKTQTLGRFLFNIILYRESKITILNIFTRELFIIFIPWFVGVGTNLISFLIFKVDINNIFNSSSPGNANSETVMFIVQITSTFYSIWYCFIFIGLFIDKRNQILYDYKMKILMLSKYTEIKVENDINEKITSNEEHIHLKKNQPGNISDEALKEIDELKSKI